ncbi:hypothetical protein J6590_107474, partial [Homalodisca vitripennis]
STIRLALALAGWRVEAAASARPDAWTRQQCAHSVANLCLRATDSRPSSASPVPYVATAQVAVTFGHT